jgi:hypothetical protein
MALAVARPVMVVLRSGAPPFFDIALPHLQELAYGLHSLAGPPRS